MLQSEPYESKNRVQGNSVYHFLLKTGTFLGFPAPETLLSPIFSFSFPFPPVFVFGDLSPLTFFLGLEALIVEELVFPSSSSSSSALPFPLPLLDEESFDFLGFELDEEEETE